MSTAIVPGLPLSIASVFGHPELSNECGNVLYITYQVPLAVTGTSGDPTFIFEPRQVEVALR